MTPSGAHDPIRILYVEANEDGTVGGSHRSLFELTRRLDRSRFEPVVLFYQNNEFSDRLRAEGIQVILFDRERATERRLREHGGVIEKGRDILVGAVRRRMALLRQERIGLVHLNNSPKVGCDDWLPASRLQGLPIMASVRANPESQNGLLVRALHRRFDRVVPVSRWLGRSVERMGFAPQKIQVVYNGVDLAGIRARIVRSRDEVRREMGLGECDLFSVLVGNLRPWKGQDVALKAVAHARAVHGVTVHLILAGEAGREHTEYETYLRRLIRDEGLSGQVRLVGKRNDVPELFAAADIAIHSSRDPEPFGLVVVEAMAVGTPVLASNRGGPKEILGPEWKFVHDPNDPRDLGEALARISRLGQAALPEFRAQVRERALEFDIRRTVRGMQEVYAQLAR